MRFVTLMYGLLLWVTLMTSSGASSDNKDNNYVGGRTTIIQLFYWRYEDIAEECERFLGPYGYAGVQTSPPSENVIIMYPWYDPTEGRPWFEIYLPVSYNIDNRLGDEAAFADMVQRCNMRDVRVYIEGVFNTICCGRNNGANDSCPYTTEDFHTCADCPTSTCTMTDYDDPVQLRNCTMGPCPDLDQSEEHVRQTIVDYLDEMNAIGVAGILLNDVMYMWPNDLAAIVDNMTDLGGAFFWDGTKSYIYQDFMANGGDASMYSEYTDIGDVTEYRAGTHLAEVFRRQTAAKFLVNWGEGWGMMNGGDAIVFVDNHVTQRGEGPSSNNVLTFFDPRPYKMANAFMLAHPYGAPRVMSSYFWNRTFVDGIDTNSWQGPPHDSDFNILPVVINSDLSCGNGWVCEHRWRPIYSIARFRNVVAGTDVENWWDNGNNQIAFSRGDKGFLVINNEESADLNVTLQTGLPAGTYCDVISGNLEYGSCTGSTVTVNSDGTAYFSIGASADDPMVAIHVKEKL